MHPFTGFAATLACVGATAQAQSLLVSQGTTIYRYQNGTVTTIPNGAPEIINGMTTVPAGMTVGNMNGGAGPYDILALGEGSVYRVTNAMGTPVFTQVGVRGGANASPVFSGGHLYGIAGDLPEGSILVEWDLGDFHQTLREGTGIFGGPGGMVAVPGTTDEFWYAEFNNDAIFHYKLHDLFSTRVCGTPSNDYVGMEIVGGQIYCSYALPGTQQFVLGIQALDGTFTQLSVLDTYQTGITGLAEIVVPAPGAAGPLGVLAVAGGVLSRRRR